VNANIGRAPTPRVGCPANSGSSHLARASSQPGRANSRHHYFIGPDRRRIGSGLPGGRRMGGFEQGGPISRLPIFSCRAFGRRGLTSIAVSGPSGNVIAVRFDYELIELKIMSISCV
jgi:hypothetical protein